MPNDIKTGPAADSGGVTMNQAFKLVILVAVLLALLYVALLLSSQSKQRTAVVPTEQPKQSDLPFDKVMVAEGILPQLFPQDLPLETDVEILENSSLTTDDGDKQSNRSYESKLTAAQNYTTFLNYMRNNNWEIVTQDNGVEQKILRGKIGYQTLMVTMVPNTVKETVTVTIIFFEAAR